MLHNNPFLDKTQEIKVQRHWLPHWHQEGKMQFVTFRLIDSLPQSKLQELRAQKEAWLNAHPRSRTEQDKQKFRRHISQTLEQYLDNGYGSCLLKEKDAARTLSETLTHHHGSRYLMHAYVIMPNHVHLLVEPMPPHNLSQIVHSWKNFSARQINRQLSRQGPLWQPDYYDRLIRNERHYQGAQGYIAKNYEQGGILYFAP